MQFKALQSELREFAKEREWEQFHSPKNLAMALSVEVAELLEIFQWLSEEESKSLSQELGDSVSEEIADVQIYLARIADILDIDIGDAVEKKLQINRDKYPADRVRGSSKKYTSYEPEQPRDRLRGITIRVYRRRHFQRHRTANSAGIRNQNWAFDKQSGGQFMEELYGVYEQRAAWSRYSPRRRGSN